MPSSLWLTPDDLEELILDEISPVKAAELCRNFRVLIGRETAPTRLTASAYARFVFIIKMALFPEESFDMPPVQPALICHACNTPLDDEGECTNSACILSELFESDEDDEDSDAEETEELDFDDAEEDELEDDLELEEVDKLWPDEGDEDEE